MDACRTSFGHRRRCAAKTPARVDETQSRTSSISLHRSPVGAVRRSGRLKPGGRPNLAWGGADTRSGTSQAGSRSRSPPPIPGRICSTQDGQQQPHQSSERAGVLRGRSQRDDKIGQGGRLHPLLGAFGQMV